MAKVYPKAVKFSKAVSIGQLLVFEPHPAMQVVPGGKCEWEFLLQQCGHFQLLTFLTVSAFIFGIWGSFGTSNIFAVSASINPLGGHIVSLVAVMALVALLAPSGSCYPGRPDGPSGPCGSGPVWWAT